MIQDGGGWTLPGGPVPPWDPTVGLVGGVVASVLARSLPATHARAAARDALQAVSVGANQLLRSGQGSREAAADSHPETEGEFAGHGKPGAVKFKRILEILDECRDEADVEQELIGGLLAASMAARRGGSDGERMMREALRFVVDTSQDSGCA